MSEESIYNNLLARAVKPYKCSGCGESIAKGERYHSIFMLRNGEYGRYKHCGNCDIVMQRIASEGVSEHYSIENPRQYLIDTRDYDETAADIADQLRLPVAYVAEVIT